MVDIRANRFPAKRRRKAIFLASVLSLFIGVASSLTVHSQDKKPKPDNPEQKDDTVKLHSDLVVVNLVVTDSAGKYAHGLSAKDFSVIEDGAAQTVNDFTTEEASFAAAILIDMSGSMEYKFGLVRGAAASFIDHIRDNDQVAVYGFNNKVKMFQDFTDLRDISEYIWDAKAEDTTRLYDCADEALVALAKRAT